MCGGRGSEFKGYACEMVKLCLIDPPPPPHTHTHTQTPRKRSGSAHFVAGMYSCTGVKRYSCDIYDFDLMLRINRKLDSIHHLVKCTFNLKMF